MTTAITFPSVSMIETLAKLVVNIVSPETKDEAQQQLVRIRTAMKNLKADVTAAKKPYKDAIDLIDAAAKPWATSLAQQDQAFESALLAYNRKVQAAVAAANVKILDKYEGKVATTEARAIAAGKPIPVVLPPHLLTTPAKTETVDGGKLTTMKRKAWRITGIDDPATLTAAFAGTIPLEYFVLDTARIGKVVRAGGSIPGIEIFEEESILVRA